MTVDELEIAAVKLITPRKSGDARGFFSETWKSSTFAKAGISVPFVQDNHAYSAAAGTVRGLHFQIEPLAQDKLIRVTRGAIFDCAVDVRASSPTYGRYVSAVLSADNWAQLFVPKGFAHGYCTLEPDTEVVYKVSAEYSPAHDRGILWDDPALGIDWPKVHQAASVSDRDRLQPRLADIEPPFA